MAEEGKAGVADTGATFGGTRQLGDWTLSRLRLQEIATLTEWVKDRRAASARISVSKATALTAVERETLIARLRAEPPNWGEMYDFMVSPEGFEQVILMSVQVKHPDATLETIKAIEDYPEGGIVRLVLWIFGVEGLPEPTGSSPRQEDEGDPPAVRVAT